MPITEDLQNYAQKLGIKIIESIPINLDKATEFQPKVINTGEFMELCHEIGIKTIFVITHNFSLVSEITESLDLDIIEDLREIDSMRKEMIKLSPTINEYEGRTYQVELYAPFKSTLLYFCEYEIWYQELGEQIGVLIEERMAEKEENIIPLLPQATNIKIAEFISGSSEYFSFHTRPNLLKSFINKTIEAEAPEGFRIDLYEIEHLSKTYFEKKYKPKLEQAFKEQIGILQKEGKSKKAIIAMLKITEGIYDSLIYS